MLSENWGKGVGSLKYLNLLEMLLNLHKNFMIMANLPPIVTNYVNLKNQIAKKEVLGPLYVRWKNLRELWFDRITLFQRSNQRNHSVIGLSVNEKFERNVLSVCEEEFTAVCVRYFNDV